MSKKQIKQITSTQGSYRHTIQTMAKAMEKTTRSKQPQQRKGRKIIADDQPMQSMEVANSATGTSHKTNQQPPHHATPDDDALLDPTSGAYKKWYEQHEHTYQINYRSTSDSMETFGSKKMWCRSMEKRNLMYTTYVGDGDSAAH